MSRFIQRITILRNLAKAELYGGDDNVSLLGRGAIQTFVLQGSGVGLALALQILLARVLGVESFGHYVYAWTWITLLLVLGQAGMQTNSLRFIAGYVGTGEWALLRGFRRFSIGISLATSMVVALVFSTVIYLLRDRLETELLVTFLLAALVLPVNALINVSVDGLRALKHIMWAQVPTFILRPLVLAALIGITLMTMREPFDGPAAMALNLLAGVPVLVLSLAALNRKMPRAARTTPPAYAAREWGSVGLIFMLSAVIYELTRRTDVLMIGYFMGTSDAGIYAAASGAARFVIFGILSVNMVFAPMIAELYAQHRMAELQKLVTLAARGIFAFSLVIGVSLAILGEWLLGLFGPAFTAAYPALLILIVGMLVNGFVGPVGFLMMMTGHHREAALVLAVAALLQIVMNAILIPRYGLIGAATATAATVALWNIVLALRTARKLGINSAALSIKAKATRQHYISRSQ